MRTMTIEKTVYTYDELTEDQKQKVLANLFDLNTSYDWYDHIYEDAKNIGLKITSFDVDSYCNGEFINDAVFTANKILSDHGDTCETYKTAFRFSEDRASLVYQMERDGDELQDNYESDIEDLETEFLQSLLEDYRIILRDELEYQSSREAIEETIACNEYEFTADGKIA